MKKEGPGSSWRGSSISQAVWTSLLTLIRTALKESWDRHLIDGWSWRGKGMWRWEMAFLTNLWNNFVQECREVGSHLEEMWNQRKSVFYFVGCGVRGGMCLHVCVYTHACVCMKTGKICLRMSNGRSRVLQGRKCPVGMVGLSDGSQFLLMASAPSVK